MTEKHYGGASGVVGVKDAHSTDMKKEAYAKTGAKEKKDAKKEGFGADVDALVKAGKIASEAREYARSFITPGMALLEIAEKIDAKILALGGKHAFPVNLSINDIAAHSTPSWNDAEKAHGLLKVDIGVHIDGFVADTAFSIDLDNNDLHRRLIEAAELGLNAGIARAHVGVMIREIGKEIETAIRGKGFVPIHNLSGHAIEQYDLHAGLTIPNVDNSSSVRLGEMTFAIEPFATTGFGAVRDGKPSGIYALQKEGNVRDPFARDVLTFIVEEYRTLPFCSRWIYKKFGARGLLALKRIEEAGLLHSYAQLIEKGGGIVAQAEHTVLLTGKEKIVTTL